MNLDQAISAYETALDNLPRTCGVDAASKIMTLLITRDAVARLLVIDGNALTPEAVDRIVTLDEKLKRQAIDVDTIAGRNNLANWRQSLQPLDCPWWWKLDDQAAAAEPQHNPLWTIPAAVLFALSLSVLADTINTLRTGGINGLTVFGTLLQSLLALLAGSAFLSGGREWLEKFFARLRINRKFQGASRVWLALGVLVLTVALRIVLPDVVARYHNRRGDEAFANKQFAAAALNYQQAVALKPSFEKAHFNLAVASDKFHDNVKAIEEYKRSIEFNPKNFTAQNNLARLLILQQKDYNGALRRLDYLRANLTQLPAEFQYYLFKNRGWANLELRNYGQAEADLIWALVKRKGAAAHYLLGRVYQEQGRNQRLNSIGIALSSHFRTTPSRKRKWNQTGSPMLRNNSRKAANMNRRIGLHGAIFVLILTATFGSSCRSCNRASNNAGALSTPTIQSSPPGNAEKATGPEDKGVVDATLIDTSVANADTAMIFKVDKEVLLKSKGAADFIRILSGLFRGGDILRVGQEAVAWVTCPDGHVCPLNTGEYTDCCNVKCANPIQLRPAEGDAPRVMMRRMDLPDDERQKFDGAELRIRQLGADDVTEQFLIANLYSSWKVAEANEEVKKLADKLKDPSSPKKLKQLYLPMVRKTGDLYFKIDKKAEAEKSYNKVVELAPAAHDENEKAAAHSSLGQLYETTGKKEAAVENLKEAKAIYEKEGEGKKATQLRRVITRVEKQ